MMKELSQTATYVLLVSFLACVAVAQEQPSNGAEYRVGSGDILEVEVYDDPDLSGLVTVQHSGEITFPLLGDVAVENLTAKEIQAKLKELLGADYLVNPQLSVRIKEHRSKWVTVVGEVARPGKYYLQGEKTLLEILTESGGFTASASGAVIVTRSVPTGPPLDEPLNAGTNAEHTDNGDNGDNGHSQPESESVTKSVTVQLTPDQPPSQQKRALSLVVKDGDIITASSTQFFFISGEVKSPGSYPVTSGLTILKAVSVAGGLSKFGSKGKVEILRKQSGGGTKRIRADLGDIEKGKKPDIPVRAEDIIKVGKRIF